MARFGGGYGYGGYRGRFDEGGIDPLASAVQSAIASGMQIFQMRKESQAVSRRNAIEDAERTRTNKRQDALDSERRWEASNQRLREQHQDERQRELDRRAKESHDVDLQESGYEPIETARGKAGALAQSMDPTIAVPALLMQRRLQSSGATVAKTGKSAAERQAESRLNTSVLENAVEDRRKREELAGEAKGYGLKVAPDATLGELAAVVEQARSERQHRQRLGEIAASRDASEGGVGGSREQRIERAKADFADKMVEAYGGQVPGESEIGEGNLARARQLGMTAMDWRAAKQRYANSRTPKMSAEDAAIAAAMGGGGGAATGGASGAPSAPSGASDAAAEYQSVVARIQASSLPADEKARRLAEAKRRFQGG